MTIELIIEKVYIPCQVCGQGFWFEYKNEVQECPYCGQRNYRKAIPTHIKRGEAGRLGGQVTLSRYGHEGMSARGKLGGRPRLPTRQQPVSSDQLRSPRRNGKGVELPHDLKGLKTLYKLQRNGTGEAE